MVILKLLLMAIIGAFIGWLTNKIALLSLFRPYEEKKILGILRFQGLLPKNQTVIARDIGNTISDELINIDEIVDELFKRKRDQKNRFFKGTAESLISDIENQLPFFSKLNPKNNMIKLVKLIASKIDISKMVEDKLNNLSMKQLEELVNKIVKKEMRHIELLGGLLGFIIGLVQGLITLAL